MNKEQLLQLLQELKNNVNFQIMDENARYEAIEILSDEIREFENKARNLKKPDEEELNKRFDEFLQPKREKISILSAEANSISEIINQLTEDNNKLIELNKEYEQKMNNLDKNSYDYERILDEFYINSRIIENNNNKIKTNNDQLNNLSEEIDIHQGFLDNVSSEEKKIKFFENEVNRYDKEYEELLIKIGTRRESRQLLRLNFESQLNGMISELQNGSLSIDDALIDLNIYKKRLFSNYNDLDEIKRNEEIEKYDNLINDLEEKLKDPNNYQYKETTKENLRNRIERIEKLERYKELEDFRNDYNEITNLYIEDRNVVLDQLCDVNITPEERVELENRLLELNRIISDGKELVSDYSKHHDMVERMKKRAYSEEIDKSQMRLDSNRLAQYKSIRSSLQCRKEYVNSKVKNILEQVPDVKIEEASFYHELSNEQNVNNNNEISNNEETNEVSNAPQQLGIVSMVRSKLKKEDVRNKIKKVAAAVIAAITVTLAASPLINNLSNSIPEPTNHEIETTIEDMTHGNELDDGMLKNEIYSQISMGDKITVNEGADIYNNQYDAVNRTNPYTPIHERSLERDIIGVTIKMPDGSFKFVQDDNSIQKLVDQGGEISACLTGENNQAEGFWNINDVTKVQELQQEMGGRSL